jgi:hypothetical protein
LASEAVTLDLLQPFQYTKLIENDTRAVGTALLNRRCRPQAFKHVELQKGEAIKSSGRGVLAIKWSDRKNVHMLSTLHEDIDIEVSKIVKEGDKEVEVKKSQSVINCNQGISIWKNIIP